MMLGKSVLGIAYISVVTVSAMLHFSRLIFLSVPIHAVHFSVSFIIYIYNRTGQRFREQNTNSDAWLHQTYVIISDVHGEKL
jgi:hypothetical protein